MVKNVKEFISRNNDFVLTQMSSQFKRLNFNQMVICGSKVFIYHQNINRYQTVDYFRKQNN